MPMRLARARVFPAVEEGKQPPAAIMVRRNAGIRGREVGGRQEVRLRLEGGRGEDEVAGDDGEFVEDEVVG